MAFFSLAFSCRQKADVVDEKIAGLSLVAGRQAVSDTAWLQVEQTHANWVSIMPYAFGNLHDTVLVYNIDRQWQGERIEGAAEAIRQAKERGLKVMLKPHLWLRGGFTGHHNPGTEEGWTAWEKNYSSYILDFTHLADSLQVEIFCIGTELTQSIINRPDYWQHLINTVKDTYTGKLTYAANWDSYRKVQFWQRMDYVGIDAYFPLEAGDDPLTSELATAWQPHVAELKSFSTKQNLPILFTEWGYRSVAGATRRPWEHERGGTINYEVQARAYQAFFTTVWPKPFVAGGFVWKWYTDPIASEKIDSDYSPQGKPALRTLIKNYQNVKK